MYFWPVFTQPWEPWERGSLYDLVQAVRYNVTPVIPEFNVPFMPLSRGRNTVYIVAGCWPCLFMNEQILYSPIKNPEWNQSKI